MQIPTTSIPEPAPLASSKGHLHRLRPPLKLPLSLSMSPCQQSLHRSLSPLLSFATALCTTLLATAADNGLLHARSARFEQMHRDLPTDLVPATLCTGSRLLCPSSYCRHSLCTCSLD